MDIRSINQGGQPSLDLNVSAAENTQNIQEVGQEAKQVDTGSKGNQQSDSIKQAVVRKT